MAVHVRARCVGIVRLLLPGLWLAGVAAAGAPDAIESESQSTGPVQEFNNPLSPAERANRQFGAQQGWAVRVEGAGAARVLAFAIGAGANQSGAIGWSVADEASLKAEAAAKALKHAQATAGQMAGALGAKLGPLVYASNEVPPLNLPINGRAFAVAKVMMDGPPAAARPLSLSAPMVHRSATVSAVFSIQ